MPKILTTNFILQEKYLIQSIFPENKQREVYIAQDLTHAQKRYSIDLFIARGLDEVLKIAETFQPELILLKNLNNDRVQQLEDFWWEEERLFIVRNLIEGVTYQELLEQKKSWTDSEVIRLFQEILPVLADLHARNIFHRNISPRSLVRRSQDNLPMLTNFGIFQEIMQQMGIISDRDTIEFPIPNSDGSQDLYDLAITGIVLLTGQNPETLFDRQTQTWRWEDRTSIDPRLSQILQRMLSPRREDRFPNAQTILQILNSSLSPSLEVSQTSKDRSETTSSIYTQSEKNASIWQQMAFLGSVVGFFLLLGAIVSKPPTSWQWQQVDRTTEKQTEISTFVDRTTFLPTTPKAIKELPQPLPSISKKEALTLISRWQNAKQEMLISHANSQVIEEFLTRSTFLDTVRNFKQDFTLLEKSNLNYIHNFQAANLVYKFYANGDKAIIDLAIADKQISSPTKNVIDRNSTAFDDIFMRYRLQKEDGLWKITQYYTINKFQPKFKQISQ